jgi:hypothetical protein
MGIASVDTVDMDVLVFNRGAYRGDGAALFVYRGLASGRPVGALSMLEWIWDTEHRT